MHALRHLSIPAALAAIALSLSLTAALAQRQQVTALCSTDQSWCELAAKEFELLVALASAPGELKSREELAKEVWGHAGVGSSRTIDVHIRRIRAALEERSSYQYIHTARGLGYRFEAKSRAGVGAE